MIQERFLYSLAQWIVCKIWKMGFYKNLINFLSGGLVFGFIFFIWLLFQIPRLIFLGAFLRIRVEKHWSLNEMFMKADGLMDLQNRSITPVDYEVRKNFATTKWMRYTIQSTLLLVEKTKAKQNKKWKEKKKKVCHKIPFQQMKVK